LTIRPGVVAAINLAGVRGELGGAVLCSVRPPLPPYFNSLNTYPIFMQHGMTIMSLGGSPQHRSLCKFLQSGTATWLACELWKAVVTQAKDADKNAHTVASDIKTQKRPLGKAWV